MQATGLSRVQVRQRLQEKTQESIKQQNEFNATVKTAVAEQVKGQQITTALPAKGFQPAPIAEGRPGRGGGDLGVTISDVIIVFNGTAYYCELSGTVGDAV